MPPIDAHLLGEAFLVTPSVHFVSPASANVLAVSIHLFDNCRLPQLEFKFLEDRGIVCLIQCLEECLAHSICSVNMIERKEERRDRGQRPRLFMDSPLPKFSCPAPGTPGAAPCRLSLYSYKAQNSPRHNSVCCHHGKPSPELCALREQDRSPPKAEDSGAEAGGALLKSGKLLSKYTHFPRPAAGGLASVAGPQPAGKANPICDRKRSLPQPGFPKLLCSRPPILSTPSRAPLSPSLHTGGNGPSAWNSWLPMGPAWPLSLLLPAKSRC